MASMFASESDSPPAPAGSALSRAPAITPDMGSCLIVDLSAIVANWRILDAKAMPVECAAVVKANAYGCGIEPVTRALAAAGCRTFFTQPNRCGWIAHERP
jgi:alanine racemase